MHSIMKTIILFFIIINVECNQEFDQMRKVVHIYYPRLENIIDYKICDESTINGVLNYDQQLITKIEECEQILDTKLSNGSYIRDLCKKQLYPTLNQSQILYNTRCNKSDHSFSNCVYETLGTTTSAPNTTLSYDDQLAKDYKELVPIKEKSIVCYQNVFNTTLNISDAENFLGKYAYKRFTLKHLLWSNGYLMGDTSLRPETHSEETELQKVTDYLKCYELLSKDCINKFNETYLQEYNEYHKGDDELHSDYFMITKLYDINEVVVMCLSEKYGNIKIKDFYEKNSQDLQSLIDCQVKVMNLANSEKESIPSEKVLRAQFNEDYM